MVFRTMFLALAYCLTHRLPLSILRTSSNFEKNSGIAMPADGRMLDLNYLHANGGVSFRVLLSTETSNSCVLAYRS